MNREQKEVLSLLNEIDGLCREWKIPYILSPKLAARAVKEKGMLSSVLGGIVFMKTEDMERFRRRLDQNMPEGRALESMMTNPYFPGFYLRYTNVNTLCMRRNYLKNFAHPCIGVDIMPIRGVHGNALERKVDKLLEAGWGENLKLEQNIEFFENEKIRALSGHLIGFLALAGRERLARRLYMRLVNHERVGKSEKVWIAWKMVRYFKQDIISETVDIDFEGCRFRIPEKSIDYLKGYYKNKYDGCWNDKIIATNSMVSTSYVGPQEFVEKAGRFEDILEDQTTIKKIDESVQVVRDEIDRSFYWLFAAAHRVRLEKFFEKKRDRIEDLADQGRLEELDIYFNAYMEILDEYTEFGAVCRMPDWFTGLLEKRIAVLGHGEWEKKLRENRGLKG